MRGLLIKELNAFKPFLILVFLIYGADFLFIPLTGYADQSLFTRVYDQLNVDLWDMGPLVLAFLALSCSSGLLVGEVDQGTIRFLDGLPTSRTRIFTAKILVAFLVLFTGPVLEASSSLFFQYFSRTSLSSGFYWELAGVSLFLHACQVMIFLSLAVLASFLRRFGWLLAALLIIVYLVLVREWPGLSVVNPALLTRPDLLGQSWIIPWESLRIQLPIAACLMVISWLLFLGGGLNFAQKLANLKNHLGGRIAMGCGSILVVALWIGLFSWMMMDQNAGEGAEKETTRVSWAEWQSIRIHTNRYLFSIPKYLEGRATPMIERADEVHDTVTTFLRVDPVPDILVDGSVASGGDYAGLAFWKTIRLSLPSIEDPIQLQATLGHETTHVYIEILSSKKMGEAFRWTRFFHEGLAEYVEQRFFEDGAELKGFKLQAAIAFDRNEARIEYLLDNQQLSAKYDTFLVYALGERFITALVDRHGDEAPSQILRAIGRDDGPKGLEGHELWRDAFQRASYNFDETVNDFYALLNLEKERRQNVIDAIPRLYGSVRVEDEWIAIEPALSFPSEMPLSCRVRQTEETQPDQYGYPIRDREGIFWVNKKNYPTLQFQLGVRAEGTVIYEPWAEGRL